MALRINIFSPNALQQPVKLKPHIFLTIRSKHQIKCSSSITDSDLASELSTEIAKINTHLVQKEEAMKKSKELLFVEFCQHLDWKADEAKNEWVKMSEEAKFVLVKRFVSEWGDNFHPLSARSIKEMMEEYLNEENKKSPSSDSSSGSGLFPGLKRIMSVFT